jgi:hypothetical protein
MGSSPLDKRIKGKLMADVFHCVGFHPYRGSAVRQDVKALKESRLRGAAQTVMHHNRRSSGSSGGLMGGGGTGNGHGAASPRRQDAWRRTSRPDSISVADLTADEWEVIFDCEDEHARRGHFEVRHDHHQLTKWHTSA